MEENNKKLPDLIIRTKNDIPPQTELGRCVVIEMTQFDKAQFKVGDEPYFNDEPMDEKYTNRIKVVQKVPEGINVSALNLKKLIGISPDKGFKAGSALIIKS